VDGRSDIYSLGIVLYQMLAGEPPFDGDSSASILAKQLTQPPNPIRRDRPDVTDEMAVVLDRMLEKEPAKRFQAAREVSRALVAALPTAARDSVHVPWRRRVASMAIKSLFGLAMAGCLAFLAFVAGAAVVAYTVFSKAPRIAARAPIPDSLARALRERRALPAGDVAEFVYQPGGQDDTTLFLVTRRRAVVVTPRQVRSYSRDSVLAGLDLDLKGGVSFRMVIRRPGTTLRDTVYRGLSFRDFLKLGPQLARLLPEDVDGGGRLRVRTGSGFRIERSR
jgi:protein kinase-like protein